MRAIDRLTGTLIDTPQLLFDLKPIFMNNSSLIIRPITRGVILNFASSFNMPYCRQLAYLTIKWGNKGGKQAQRCDHGHEGGGLNLNSDLNRCLRFADNRICWWLFNPSEFNRWRILTHLTQNKSGSVRCEPQTLGLAEKSRYEL